MTDRLLKARKKKGDDAYEASNSFHGFIVIANNDFKKR